jgi:hypothetical protein
MTAKFIPGCTIFKMYSERGLPPEISVMLANDSGCTVEWPSFISEARRNGWSYKRIFTTIITAVKQADIFTQQQVAEFTKMAEQFFSFSMALESKSAAGSAA